MRRTVLALLMVIVIAAPAATAEKASVNNEHWVPTWGTAQQLIKVTPPPAPSTAAAPPPAAPAAATPPPFRVTTLNNQTVRMVLRTSIAGRRVRVKLSNAYGMPAVAVGSAHVARRGTDAGLMAGTDRKLTFGGKSAFTMRPGVVVVSDPVDLDVPALSDLAISLFFPQNTETPTTHATGLRPTYVSTDGDFTGASEFPLAGTTQQYYWLTSVEVVAPQDAGAIVAFGDSITDGSRSTPDTNHAWPALLAARLAADKKTANLSVVNEGIGGNRLFTDAAGLAGVSALARFDRDVLSHPNVKWLMILEGINDIGSLATPATNVPVTTDDLMWVMKEMVAKAHAHGIKVVGCTLTRTAGQGTPGTKEKPSAPRSTSGFAPRGPSMRSWTSRPRRATPPIRRNSRRNSIQGIIFTRTTRATRPWPTRWTSASLAENPPSRLAKNKRYG